MNSDNATQESAIEQDWPGDDSWLCDDCNEPHPTATVLPCRTSDGRRALCPGCRDQRGVDPIALTDGGETVGAQQGTVLDGHEQDADDNEYATPPEVWRPLDRAVDGFDVDPCSGAEPTPIADTRYTAEDDGLRQAWHGAVWMNPPWSSNCDGSAKETWLRKARNEAARESVDIVVGILPADTSAHWWHDHIMQAEAVCLVGPGRIPFIGEDRNPAFALSLFAFGSVDGDLLDAMDGLGSVLVDGDRHEPAPQTTLGGAAGAE